MLSIKRLPALSASKIQPKQNFLVRNTVVERHINKQCQDDLMKLCRSFSLLHSLTSKSRNPQLRQFNAEYKAACALIKRSSLPRLSSVFTNNVRGFRTSATDRQNKKDDKDEKDKNKKNAEMSSLIMKAAFWMFTTCFLIILSSLIVPGGENGQNEMIRYVSWNEFVYSMLSKGEVQELIVRPDLEVVTIILHEGAIIKGKRTTHRAFHMNVGDIHRFEEKLRETEKNLGVKEGVRVIYDRNGSVAGKVITTLLIAAVILSFLYSSKSMRMNINLGGFFTLVDSMSGQGKGVKFEDVAGLREAKVEVMEFVDYLKRPEHYKSLGAKVPKGALLLGPPGCGKTLLAKAVATEANVPFLSMNGSEFIEMIGGLGAARVRDLFKEALARAPCIIYIDEMDAVGRARSSGPTSFGPGSGGTEKRSHAMSPTEKRVVAYHEAGHALTGWLLEHTDALLKVTIVPRTNMALGFAQYTSSNQKLFNKEELFDRMCMALGGRAAEAIIFNSITSGAQNDLEKVTKIAYAQIQVYGMSQKVGLLSFPDLKQHGMSPFSKTLKNLMDLEARKLIGEAYFRTEKLLLDNKAKLIMLAEELLKKETLIFNDLQRILGPPPFPQKKYIEPVEFETNLKSLENATAPDNTPIGAPSAKPDGP
ncbi:hypothetical protein HF086_008665 [Spodoptera exigua]|uniref:AAA+ ATPase domain-containing protein n=1 Tax=Spodoptera exigua TaxID=7107 RepID=A0A922SNR1_SPOEX|nr:hypothetical protein HF086_008665 [Spodoptera exigua]